MNYFNLLCLTNQTTSLVHNQRSLYNYIDILSLATLRRHVSGIRMCVCVCVHVNVQMCTRRGTHRYGSQRSMSDVLNDSSPYGFGTVYH